MSLNFSQILTCKRTVSYCYIIIAIITIESEIFWHFQTSIRFNVKPQNAKKNPFVSLLRAPHSSLSVSFYCWNIFAYFFLLTRISRLLSFFAVIIFIKNTHWRYTSLLRKCFSRNKLAYESKNYSNLMSMSGLCHCWELHLNRWL